MKNKNLILVAVLFTISVIMAFANGPTPQVVIDTDQIIDGAVTILKTDGVAANDLSNVTPATGRSALGLGTVSTINSPVPIANGGTGKTTAAAGLAALGGASLNGSSTVDFAAANASFSGDIEVDGAFGIGVVPDADFDMSPQESMVRARIHSRTNTTPISILQLMRGYSRVFGYDAYGDYQLKNSAGNITLEYGESETTTVRATVRSTGIINLVNVPEYANNAAAKAAGLVNGDLFRIAGDLQIVYTP